MSSNAPIVLIVDDEVQIRRFLRAGFELDGFAVEEADTGNAAIRKATLTPPDLLIVDLGLPDMDGSEIVQRLRSWSNVPLIVLSVRSNEAEKVRLLELGADDYVVKPFGMAELLARAHAALRRRATTTTGEPIIRSGRLTIDFGSRLVTIDGERVPLTPKEYRLLQVLAQHAGNVVTHQHLLKEVWGSPHVHDIHYLRIFVRKLRQKIEVDATKPQILLTELGIGYRLAMPARSARCRSAKSLKLNAKITRAGHRIVGRFIPIGANRVARRGDLHAADGDNHDQFAGRRRSFRRFGAGLLAAAAAERRAAPTCGDAIPRHAHPGGDSERGGAGDRAGARDPDGLFAVLKPRFA